jgi:two-component system, chemotaxis family, chemotaxis protein CheV
MKSNILLETGTNELEVIEFLVSQPLNNGGSHLQSYGINVAKVREIIKLPEITMIPNMPESITGVFNMRNHLITSIDLRKYLYGEYTNSESASVIISEFNNIRFGFVVDTVTRIHRFSWQRVEAPEVVNRFAGDDSLIVGIVKLEDKNILLLDVEKIVVELQPEFGMKNINDDDMNALQGKLAFVAEDSTTIRNMITGQLKRAGFTIEDYSDGGQLWRRLNDMETKINQGSNVRLPDVIITDIEMPQMDGYTLIRKIKTSNTLKRIPVAIFSSLVNSDVIHKGRAVGADIQLTKPQLNDLVSILKTHLTEAETLAEV